MTLSFQHSGFDFTFDSYDPDSSAEPSGPRVCGVLRCIETLPGRSSDQASQSRSLTRLTVSKIQLGGDQSASTRWQELASVTPHQPTLDQVSDGILVTGQLSDHQASLTLRLKKSQDCQDTQFSCVAVLVDDQGRTTVKKSLVGRAVDTADFGPQMVKTSFTPHGAYYSGDQTGEIGATFLHMKLNRIESRLEDSLKTMGNRLEDKIGELNPRINNLENRLEDKMAELPDRVTHNLRQRNSVFCAQEGSCDKLDSKLDGLNDKLTGLVSSVAGLSDLTQDLISEVSSVRDAYKSGTVEAADEYFDPLDSGKKEWRLAFRGTAYNNVRVYPAYMLGTGIPVEVEQGCKQFNHSLPCVNHYRNRDAFHNWAGIDEVLFAIYKDGQMVKRVIFNGKGSTFTSWFAADRVIQSSWVDLTTQPHNYFSIQGADHGNHWRRFFMNLDYDRSCDGFRGWFKATESQAGCPVEKATLAIPMFKYAPGDTFALWQSTAAEADAFGIFLKYE